MKLTPKELKILAACETEADLSIAMIAKRTGSPEHVVQRVLQLLSQQGVIHRRAYMNSFLVGTIPFLIGFALNPDGRKIQKKLDSYLIKRPEVSYVAHVSGRFNLFIEARFTSTHQIQNFLDQLSLECGNIFSKKEILSLTAMYDLPVFANLSERLNLREFATSVSDKIAKLDKIDYQILQELSKSWEEPNTQISKRLNIPVSTFDYHVKRMRKDGVLLGARYFPNLFNMGFHTYYHAISMKGFHPELRERVLNYVRKEKSVHCLRVFLGAWDFLIECHYSSAAESIEFTDNFVEEFSIDISNIESYSVLKLEKVSDCTVNNN